MIQAITETDLTFYLQTEDNRIDTSVASSSIRYLVKFTNDLDKSIQYAYSDVHLVYNRYTKFSYTYNATPDVYTGAVNFKPSGYWKYEVYEVAWGNATALLDEGTAPATELDVLLPKGDTKGIVQGLVTKGILNVTEKPGSEEVQYVQNAKSVLTLTINFGGVGYTTAPTITITGDNITQATATCTISGGVVNTVTITNAGSGS